MKTKRHRYDDYTLLQVFPGIGYESVWWDDEKGLYADAVDFLGLALCKTLEVAKLPGSEPKLLMEDNVIVAISIQDGYENIDNECNNFCGIRRSDSTRPLWKDVGRLDGSCTKAWEYIRKMQVEEKEAEKKSQ